MSRGFGATLGVGATDRITSALTSTSLTRSYHLWTNRNGNGGGGFGRIIEQDGKYVIYDDFDGSGGAGAPAYAFIASWTTTAGLWRMARPSGSVDHAIGWSYDGGNVANDPLGYVDGAGVNVTQVGVNPAGSAPSGTAAIRLGNAPASDRGWNGTFARLGIWDRILTPAEFAELGRGVGPQVFPASLVEYMELNAPNTGMAGTPTIVGTAVQPDMPALLAAAGLVFHPVQA